MTRTPPLPDLAVLRQAAADLRYLLNRGYPREASLALVGNRYDLDRRARQILHRGVFAEDLAHDRLAKLRPLADAAGRPLAVDGHNVLITLECALRGMPLVLADDGFIRDVAELSRAFRVSRQTDLALELLADYLKTQQTAPVTVLYDAPMSKSGELARRTREIFTARGLTPEVSAAPVPEKELLVFPGAIATSDTHLIDAQDDLIDLAGEIIRREAERGRQVNVVLLQGNS